MRPGALDGLDEGPICIAFAFIVAMTPSVGVPSIPKRAFR